MRQIFLFITFIIFSYSVSAENFCTDTNHRATMGDTILFQDRIEQQRFSFEHDTNRNITAGDSISPHWKRKKITAAILAFPLPFGLLGLHRIYLGTKPYVPFVYIGTIGGCLFVLPLIDFITILTAKEEDFKRFEKNPGVFMWSH